jgi:hypothetical protein
MLLYKTEKINVVPRSGKILFFLEIKNQDGILIHTKGRSLGQCREKAHRVDRQIETEKK